jgi:mannose-1-phosphate guanylyltransferase
VFSEYFGDGAALGMELEYVVESEPLGTGGGIRNVADRLRGDTTMIFNGDVLSGLDLRALLARHAETDADVTLYLTPVEDPRAFGCVPTDADGRVTAFLEKHPNPVTDKINAGTYVFRRAIVDSIPAGRPVSVERETFPGLLAAGACVVGHVDSSYWRDLGKPSDFVAGSADLVRGFAPSSALPGPKLSGGTTVGAGCVVGAGARVDGSVLFDGARVGAEADVRCSVIGRDAVVGAGVMLDNVVIGDRARIGAGVELVGGCRVWPDAVIADGSVRFSSDV